MLTTLERLTKLNIGPKTERARNLIKKLPETSGVYAFLNNDGKVIYVGKAINVKRRVSSYFDLELDLKTTHMMQDAMYLSFIQVDSELSALLLEARLIRAYMPHYNIAAKDDKHPLYIIITKENYPRIVTARKTDINNTPARGIYGPFPASRSVKSVLRMIRKVFPYSDHKLGKRPCLYSHIGLCEPCPSAVAEIKNSELRIQQTRLYLKNIRNIKFILDGRINKVSKQLEKEMKHASDKENYEEAMQLRNKVRELEYITRPQLPTDFYIENPNLYEDVRKAELTELKKLLVICKLKIENCTRIECYDIAHLSGTNPTASMVTVVNGASDKKYYRHFKIKKAKGGDDYNSLSEVARRRARHFDDWGKPDLIIVDGGVGQVKSFDSVINEIGSKIPVIGIAKHPDRLIIPATSDKSEKSYVKVKLEGPALNLVSRMRDEAHRFARRLHHKLVSRAIVHPN